MTASTELLCALQESNPERYPYLLESTAKDNSKTARYSLLLAYPSECLALDSNGLSSDNQKLDQTDFLDALNQRYKNNRVTSNSQASQVFNGGWFIYLGYELAEQIEPSLRLPAHTPSCLPTAFATRCAGAIVIDHATQSVMQLVEDDHKQRADLLQQMQQDLVTAKISLRTNNAVELKTLSVEEDPPQDFISSISSIKEYIRNGDVFQVNLSRQWRLSCEDTVTSGDLYQALRKANPAPFAGRFEWSKDGQRSAVISSSPERLISVQSNKVETRPIAGTRPRQSGALDEQNERNALISHPKERAEHIMLIDLERNDLGRVCEPGSIEVDELMSLESYAHVHHIVSNVSGQLRSDKTPVDALRAVFPGGTITGCPKVHCMEIIAELEGVGRGPYTGAMGYLDRSGNLDMNILIRSLVLEDQQISFRAGAGIVADSNPEAELQETRHKARGLLAAFKLSS